MDLINRGCEMRDYECCCLDGQLIDYDTQGAFCPTCQGFLRPTGDGLIEETIWKSVLCKEYVNQLAYHAGDGFGISMDNLKESILALVVSLKNLEKGE
jgi:hypothetical protein